MRAVLHEVVAAELAAGGAVPALSCYDFTTALAVVGAAEQLRRPVIVLVPPKTAAGPAGMRYITALRGLADAAAVPVCIQLDHAADPELIRAAVDAGADAVLADGSALAPEANARFTAGVVQSLAGRGVSVEAELGALPGDEDNAAVAARTAGSADPDAGLTDPALVPDFLAASGAHLLAVAVGNAHGTYQGVPRLDWPRLERIRTAAGPVPLVLHGASGLPAADLEAAAAAGIGKVNINTELRTAMLAALEAELGAHRADGENMLGLLRGWSRTAASVARGAFAQLGPARA